jgi:NAD-dependent deacetylase
VAVTAPDFDAARSILGGAAHIVVLSGAGISTASGIPDFRGPEGLWTKDPAAEMLSSFDVWVSDSNVRHRAWRSRAQRSVFDVQPSDAHRALVGLEERGVLDLIVTQNIDGLHQRAGSSPDLVVEIHGSALDCVCLTCSHREPIDATLERVRAGDDDPTCLQIVNGRVCSGMLKSATISFGQSLVPADLHRSEVAARRCDVLLAVGSTLSVYPVAGLVPIAKSHGAAVVIVNGEETAMDDLATVDRIGGDLKVELPRLLAG